MKEKQSLITDRRSMLTTTLLAGGGLFLGSAINAPANANVDDPDVAKETTLADTLLLYAQLLDNMKSYLVFALTQNAISGKGSIREELSSLEYKARRLRNEINKESISEAEARELYGFTLLAQTSLLTFEETLAQIIQFELTEIPLVGEEIEQTVTAPLLEAVDELRAAPLRALPKSDFREPAIVKATVKIRNAIEALRKFDKRKYFVEIQNIEFTSYVRPSEVIDLLLVFVEESMPANQDSSKLGSDSLAATRYAKAGYSENPRNASTITGTYRTYIRSPSYLQLVLGYAIAAPILYKVSSQSRRRNLLKGPLRILAPGLSRRNRSICANALSRLRLR